MNKMFNYDKSEIYGLLIGVGFWIILPLTVIFWNHIESFFASSQKAKCEAFIPGGNTDLYCTTSGERQSRMDESRLNCNAQSPYFEWNNDSETCNRLKYKSKADCIADDREKIKSYEGEAYGIRCENDGTWSTYDPDYEDYLSEQNIRLDSTYCVDVTSYDYNWDNDVLCTRPDGSQFYTSYEGAKKYGL